MNKAEKRVLVGMSGGIDSTATCLMLREQGYEIVGLTMWVWGDEPSEARQLAQSMGIEHYVAEEARCHDFIMALPDGYDTDMGQMSARLSAK